MKRILILPLLFIIAFANAQSGVYNSLEDFKNNKLSKPCESINIEQVGSNYFIILVNGSNKEKIKLSGSGLWGFKKGMTDYRIIENLPRAIATKGEIWIYSGYMDDIGLEKKTNDTTYFKGSNVYPYASKGVDGKLVLLHNPKELYALMDPVVAEEVKAKIKKFLVTGFLEDMADYYNSLRPGYQSTRFKQFYYLGGKRTANGKRPITF